MKSQFDASHWRCFEGSEGAEYTPDFWEKKKIMEVQVLKQGHDLNLPCRRNL